VGTHLGSKLRPQLTHASLVQQTGINRLRPHILPASRHRRHVLSVLYPPSSQR
jgi:hypothetical protein